ncbi:glutathione peroxidase [Echinicola jeungdonensis]|uniref:Glutathione peroxidase n=1 Tax=Echinicola jeungdonensis TaxID=709343 RepID=A0ABV5J8X6_9BACT|nr:glutathione peroxidase [Echinicola jeungdonensis]MDN3670221.1 glutathione peroxidase [Echinicola jeungdonensis]
MKQLIYFCLALALVACHAKSNDQKSIKPTVTTKPIQVKKSFYDFEVNDIDGNPVEFGQFKGKKVMLVNVASKCGYTPQYADLQNLHQQYGDKIVILGFPANNFGGQEPGTNEDIKKFCSQNYGVTFKMFDKISVTGADKHPLYRWLSDRELNGWNNQEPSWNFCKYIINEEGKLTHFFPSSVNPMDDKILELLGEA